MPVMTQAAEKLLQASLKKFFVSTIEKQLGKTNLFDNAVFKSNVVKASKFSGDTEFPGVIKHYENIIRRGERPNILTLTNERGTHIIDGLHKLQAYKNLGIRDVPAIDANLALPKYLGGE